MSKKNRTRMPTSYSLSDRAKDLLELIANHYGTNKSATIEMMIRHHARELGLLKGATDKSMLEPQDG